MALGLPWLICGDTGRPDVGGWTTLARDVGLDHAASHFGVRLREFHPRAAAENLVPSPEFNAHFRDSYAPLIRRSLDHGQTVLAWRGWPPPADQAWGLITGVDSATGALLGVVSGVDGAVPLVSAALQCFAVEEVRPETPDAETILACAVQAVTRLHAECVGTTRTAGADALAAWRACAAHAAGNRDLAEYLLTNRQAGFRWCQRRLQAECSARRDLGSLCQALQETVEVLGRLRDALLVDSAAAVGERFDELMAAESQSTSALLRVAARRVQEGGVATPTGRSADAARHSR